MKKVMLIGESWFTYSVHQKGFDTFYTSDYTEGAGEFISALNRNDIEVEFIPAHLIESKVPDLAEGFESYDAIIISDVGANSFLLSKQTFTRSEIAPNKLSAINKYVEQGGALLMVGGYMSFTGIDAKARYGQSPIQACLPVTMLNWDDRVEIPEGVVPTSQIPNHEILEAIPEEYPPILGYNKIAAKPGSEVILSVAEDPLLVVHSFGKGRAAAFSSDIAPHWAPPEFINWKGYPKLWKNLIGWLAA